MVIEMQAGGAESPGFFVEVPALPLPLAKVEGGVSITFEQVFFGGITLLVSGGLACGKWLIDREFRRLQDRHTDIYDRLKSLDDRLVSHKEMMIKSLAQIDQRIDDFKLQANQMFVSRDDYLRHQTLSEAKLDALHRRLDEMMGLLMRRGEK